jgi:hypothetical protein
MIAATSLPAAGLSARKIRASESDSHSALTPPKGQGGFAG